MRHVAKALRNNIAALTIPLANFSNPNVASALPFPFPGSKSARFAIDHEGYFSYVGRTRFSSTLDELDKTGHEINLEVNLYGTKGYGKSHILAAIVVWRIMKGKRVVYIPLARSMAKSPFDYLRDSLIMAFAEDDDKLDQIDLCSDINSLVTWAWSESFELYVDQFNSLEESSKISEKEKEVCRSLLARLSAKRLYVRGLSANNQTVIDYANTERAERDIVFLGGFLVPEFDGWLLLKQNAGKLPVFFNPIDLEHLKDKTGCVPMYLELFSSKYFDLKDVRKAIGACILTLGSEITGFLGDFAASCLEKERFYFIAEDLLLNRTIQLSPKLIDHRYFYRMNVNDDTRIEGRGYAVCGIARDVLVILLRKKNDRFLQDIWFDACRQSSASAQGFMVEQIVISSIQSLGLQMNGKTYAITENRFFKIAAEAPLTKDIACVQYVPEPFNNKFFDSLVRFCKLGVAKKKPVDVIFLQSTFQQIPTHIHSLDIFANDDYKTWVRDMPANNYKLNFHFVWVVKKTQYATRRKEFPRVHAETATTPAFTEHILSFENVNPKLNFLD